MQNISSWHRSVVLIIKVLPFTIGDFHPRVLGNCTQLNDPFQIRSPWPLSLQWNCDSCSLEKIYKSVSLWTKINMRSPQTCNLLSKTVAFWHQPVQWDMTEVQTGHGVKSAILAPEWEAIPWGHGMSKASSHWCHSQSSRILHKTRLTKPATRQVRKCQHGEGQKLAFTKEEIQSINNSVSEKSFIFLSTN